MDDIGTIFQAEPTTTARASSAASSISTLFQSNGNSNSTPEIGPSSPSALKGAGIEPASTTTDATTAASDVTKAVINLGQKLGIVPSSPQQITPPVTKSPIPTNIFSNPSATVSDAVASVGKGLSSLKTNTQNDLSNLWDNVKNEFTAPIPKTANGEINGEALPGLAPLLPKAPAYNGQPSLSEGNQNAIPANSFQNFLSSINMPTSVVKNPITDTIGNAFDDTVSKATTAIENDTNKDATVSQKIGSSAEAAASIGKLLLSPISSIFGVGEANPVTKLPIEAISYPFKLIGQGITLATTKIINALPISQNAKDNITAPISDLLSLVGQIYTGEVAADVGLPIVKDKINDIQTTLNQNLVMNAIAHTDNPDDVATILRTGGVSEDDIANLKEPLAQAKTVAEVKDVLSGNDINAAGPKEADTNAPKELSGTQGNLPGAQDLQNIADEIKTKSTYAKVNNLSSTPEYDVNSPTLKAFEQSKPIQTIGKFELGTFGENASNRKVNQIDRFPQSELPDTIAHITESYRASNDPKNYRYDNIANIAKMPNGEIRVVYTRINASGKQEILNWHKVSNPQYVETLRSFGVPERTRTSNLSVRTGVLDPLSYRNNESVGQKGVKSQDLVPQSKNITVNPAFRTLDMGNLEGTKENAETKAINKERIAAGNVPMGNNGTGETFEQFEDRVLPEFNKILNSAPEGTTVVTHSSVLKLLKQWEDQGRPSTFRVDPKDYNQLETHTGDVETFKGKNGDIYVARHGQTEDNVESNFRSATTNLTQQGIDQAKEAAQEIAQKLNGKPIPQIISSDLPRAIHTSNILNESEKDLQNKTPSKSQMDATAKLTAIATDMQNGLLTRQQADAEIQKVLDEAEKERNNEDNGKITGSTKSGSIQESSEGTQYASLPSDRRILPLRGIDRLEARQSLVNYTRNDGSFLDKGALDHADELLDGKSVIPTKDTPDVLKALGYTDNFVKSFQTRYEAGGFKTITFNSFLKNGKGDFVLDENKKLIEINASYTPYNRNFDINYFERNAPKFQDGRLVHHEIDGHAFLSLLNNDDAKTLINSFKNDQNVIKEAWLKSESDHNQYWQFAISHIVDQLTSVTNDAAQARKIATDAGLTDEELSLDKVIDHSFNLDSFIKNINDELKKYKLGTFKYNTNKSIIMHENIALVAESAPELTSNDPIAQSYIDRVVQNNLAMPQQVTSRTLTPSTMAAIKSDFSENDDLQDLLKSAEEKAREDRQGNRLTELNQVVADSNSHDAFVRNLQKNEKLGQLLPQLDKDVRDNGYTNLTDYYVKNKITFNNEKGIVPQRQYAKPKAITTPEIKKIAISNKEVPMSEKDKETLDQIKTQRGILEDMVDEHPGKKLQKFVSKKEGIFEDFKDPDSVKTPSERKAIEERNKNIVTTAESVFDGTPYKDQYDNPDVIRAAIEDYQGLKNDLEETKQTQKAFTDEERRIRNLTKDEVALEKLAKRNSVKEMPESVQDVTPPEARGGLKSPKLDFSKWKDVSAPRLSRETFERNIETVAPKSDADKIKKFIVDPVRANETARVKFSNELKLGTRAKMKELGIARNSVNDELIQKFGEGQISLTELQKVAPKKWGEIQQAAAFYRNAYDKLLDKWNDVREQYGYPKVPKRPDYFRHFDEINFLTKTFGLMSSKNELPTELAGKTEFFKPGKPFSTAELSRTGNSTKYSAIGGFDNYIDSVSKQIYHIDSIQRGRALEKYIDASAKVGAALGTPLRLPNTVANIREYVNTGLAGKTATLDRAVESIVGRPAIQAFHNISNLIGKNIIVGNISTALSHLVSIPLIGATTDTLPLMKGLMTTLTAPLMKNPYGTIDGQESAFLTRRFPIEESIPTLPKKAEDALGYLFKITDQFKSRLAVAGKYYENIGKGMSKEDAMKNADTYAGRVIGDYSVGQKPNLMNAKTMALLAQFQLGLNDSMSVLFHDIPYQDRTEYTDPKTGETKSKANYKRVIWKAVQFAVFSYLFNEILKQVRGSGKGLDPIDLTLTLFGLNDEGQGKTFGQRALAGATDVAGELPFTSMFTGNFPLATAFDEPITYLEAGDYKKAAESIISDFISPIGGGSQAVKTYEGVQAINAGEATTRAQKAQALMFGPKSTLPTDKASQTMQTTLKSAQTRLSKYDQSVIDSVQPAFDAAKAAGYGTPAADAAIANLTDAQYKVYKAMKEVDIDQTNLTLEPKVLPIVQQAQALGFGTDAANKLVNDAFPDTPQGNSEYAAYQAIKTALYGANPQSDDTGTTQTAGNGIGTSEQTYEQQSFVTHIANIAKALGSNPVETFQDLFAGNSSYRIIGVKNGNVFVARMPLATSQAIKKSEGGENAEYKLDHTIPLESTGNNGSDNLQLIPTGTVDQVGSWAWNTPYEDMTAAALNAGKITGAQAREYMIRLKATAGEPMSPALQKEFKNTYKGEPLSPDQLKSLLGQ